MYNKLLSRALLTGTMASLASCIALILVAKAEGKGVLQPVNATSHWLNGDQAASFVGADRRRTAVGYATHHAATVFWAAIFEAWLATRLSRSAPELLRDGLVMSAIAAAVDYGPTPRRFTPGWEFVLSKWGMAIVYVAMGIGLAAGVGMTPEYRANRR